MERNALSGDVAHDQCLVVLYRFSGVSAVFAHSGGRLGIAASRLQLGNQVMQVCSGGNVPLDSSQDLSPITANSTCAPPSVERSASSSTLLRALAH
jgi:hypothetical protein